VQSYKLPEQTSQIQEPQPTDEGAVVSFASISNQNFANSNRTLELGFVRFDKGIKEPLRQFLFFADVYSLKGDQTYFYQFDTGGKLDRQTVPVTRDANGFIDSLRSNGKHYRFVRDKEGAVVKYSVN